MIINNKSLTYCSNIFKEKKIYDLLFKLGEYSEFLQKKFKKKYIGLGLCFSNSLVNEIIFNNYLSYLKIWLKKYKFYLSSLNAFVYKTFHKKKIKEYIYYPDWTSRKRVTYTNKSIIILDNLITKIKNCSISTSPISFKSWMLKKNRKYIFFKSSINILSVLESLINLNNKSNNYIHLDIEPEPGCLIETFNDFLYFFNEWLKPSGKFYMHKIYGENFILKLKKYINLCYDVCHFSVNYDDHLEIIRSILKHKIKVGKVQVSSALEVFINNDNKDKVTQELSFLKNSKFLHQNTSIFEKNLYKFKNFDICQFLDENYVNLKTRIHCHMPLYLTKYKSSLYTTSDETCLVLKTILNTLNVKHVEIETYTYDLLSKNKKFESIYQEYFLIINIINNKYHD